MENENSTINDLINRVSIYGLLAKRKAAIALISEATALLRQAENITRNNGMGDFDTWLGLQHSRGCLLRQENAMEAVIREIDRSGWNYLMNESDLKTFVDTERRDKWCQSIRHSDEFPVLDMSNIEATFSELHKHR